MIGKDGENDEGFVIARHRLAGLRASVALLRLTLHLRRGEGFGSKAGYDPDQPRHPRGSGRSGGRWRGGGSGSGSTDGKTSGRDGPDREPTNGSSTRRTRRLRLPRPGIGHNGGPPLEDPPDIAKRDPGTFRERYRIAKRSALWLLRALQSPRYRQAAIVALIVEKVGYLTGFFDDIEASLDPPRSLDDLRRAVRSEAGRPGTQVHHIVEKTSAYQDGFPPAMVES